MDSFVFSQSSDNSGEVGEALSTAEEGEVRRSRESELFLSLDQEPVNDSVSLSTVSAWDVIRIIIIFGILIAVTYFIIWLLKRIQKRSFINSELIEVISTQSLHQGSTLYLVKTGESYLLLGGSGQSVTLLKEFKDKEEKDELILTLPVGKDQSEPKNRSFRSIFRGFFSVRRTISKQNSSSKYINVLNKHLKKGEELNGEI